MRLLIAPLAALIASPTLAAPPAGYDLVWSDEFDGTGLPDPAKWHYDTEANATGWYNNELQYYAANRAENARLQDGSLLLTARREKLAQMPDYGGQSYSSARLHSRDTASWTYGFFEIRAKLPCGGGTWPAIWMLGTADLPHPANGEIDIMEQVGNNPTSVEATIYTAATGAELGGITAATEIDDACRAFHLYQLTWTPKALQIGVDGRVYFSYAKPADPAAWPFDKPQYLLLNLAIGGDMGGAVDDGIFPVQMQVDYVRVYQRR